MAMSPHAQLHAILFAAGEPISKKRLAALLNLSPDALRAAAMELHKHLEGSGLTLVEAGEELELRTASEAADLIKKLRESELSRDLGKAGLEALAVIIYKNGATRSEVDWVRGVNSTAALRSLLLRGMVSRSEDVTDRRRTRYMPTVEALAQLGVSHVSELPQYDELTKELQAHEARALEEISTEHDS